MDPERERIQADLRGLLDGEVYCDDLFLQVYATDASIYEIRPLGIVRPRGVSDVVACVQYAAENNIPLHARGAGTGLAGESLGPGLILDFSYHMRRVLEVGEDTVRVQPGLVLAQLNAQLHGYGRLFGPDPATRSVTTMGSVLAVDASGSHWPQYGSARDHVLSLEVVLSDGSIMTADRVPVNSLALPPRDRVTAIKLGQRIADLIERERPLIEGHRPASPTNNSGYHLYDVLQKDHLDLARLLVGSEGTLALITEATIRTSPLPPHRGVALFYFDRLENAAQGALELSTRGISACDLVDRRLLTISREVDHRFEELIPLDAEALLLVELQDEDAQNLRKRIQDLVQLLQRKRRLAFAARSTLDTDERNLYWHLVRRVIPRIYRLKGSTRPLPFVEDIAVPPAVLPDFLVRMQNVLKTHQVTATLFAHAAHGQLHIRPFLDLADPEDVRRMQELSNDLYELVLDAKGTISGEHGEGLSRTWFANRQHGPLYDVFREVKRIFDPSNLFNPGKVVAEVAQPLTKNLRPVTWAPGTTSERPDAGKPEPLTLQLVWPEQDITHTARSCNGCGRCRTQWQGERMCPIFRFAPREEATPRAKANLVRAILTGQLELDELSSDAMKSIADLCVNCHQCRFECPANVDIPKLMVEAKSQYVATNGQRPTDWLLTRLDLLARFASMISPVSNWAIGNRQMRWLMEKAMGIAQGRKLPRVSSRTFIRMAQRRRLTRPARSGHRKVFYFLDVYANWFDVQLAESLVAILEHNGVSVYLHPAQVPAGMQAVSDGATEVAKWFAARNVPLLAEAVRQGYQIVTTEPSAALCLSHEYRNLSNDDDTELVAQNTMDACAYLWKLHQAGNLELDLKPVNVTVGYHLPCHSRAMDGSAPAERLLGLIPGLTVQRIERGCSGMSGTFGMKQSNYRSSLRAGWGLISALRDPVIQCGATECSSCKVQMEQGTTKPTIHPLKLLALSYGLMPDIGKLLTARGEELIVT